MTCNIQHDFCQEKTDLSVEECDYLYDECRDVCRHKCHQNGEGEVCEDWCYEGDNDNYYIDHWGLNLTPEQKRLRVRLLTS